MAVLFFVLMVERILFYFVYHSSRREIVSLREEFFRMQSEFVKLAALMQAFLMNVRFKDSGEVESKFKSTDTQVMVSSIELERLREAERFLREESVDRLLHRRQRREGETSENDENGEIIQ